MALPASINALLSASAFPGSTKPPLRDWTGWPDGTYSIVLGGKTYSTTSPGFTHDNFVSTSAQAPLR